MTLILASKAANELRDGHYVLANDGSTYQTVLYERARTNQHTRSRDFTQSVWSKLASSITDDAIEGPDGVEDSAQKIVESTATGTAHGINRSLSGYGLSAGVTQGTRYAMKAGERTWAYIQTTDLGNTTRRTWFNLATGAIGTTGSGHTPYVTALGNDWYIISILWSAGTGASTPATRIVMCRSNNEQAYDGDGTSGAYIAWAQHELNISALHPTSLIETTTVADTRPADVGYVAYSRVPQARSTLYTFVEMGAVLTTNGTLDYIGNAGNTGARFWVEAVGGVYTAVYHNGSTSVSSTLGTAPALYDRNELLVTQASTGAVQIAQSINGGVVSTAAASSTLALESAWSDTRRYHASKGGSEVGTVAFCRRSTGAICVTEFDDVVSFAAARNGRGTVVTL